MKHPRHPLEALAEMGQRLGGKHSLSVAGSAGGTIAVDQSEPVEGSLLLFACGQSPIALAEHQTTGAGPDGPSEPEDVVNIFAFPAFDEASYVIGRQMVELRPTRGVREHQFHLNFANRRRAFWCSIFRMTALAQTGVLGAEVGFRPRSVKSSPNQRKGNKMDLDQAIRARRAVREYTTEPIDEATLHRLIDAAIQAPSAVNEQPWLFSVVQDKIILGRISSAARILALATPPVGMASHHVKEILDDPDFDVLYHAPALIVISSKTNGRWAIENCALAAENLMLAARSAGLGTCWIGFAQPWLGTAEGKATIKVPQDSLPVAPIIVGHPKSFPAAVPRKTAGIRWIGRNSVSEAAAGGRHPVLHLRSS